MRLCVCELPHRHGDVAGQVALLDRTLARHAQPDDFVVLPELALTGYVSAHGNFDLTALAGDIDLSHLETRYGIKLITPMVERCGENLFNTLRGHYRKRHPWYPETWARAGDLGHPLITWRGLRFTFAVCFDVHFLHEEAADALNAADWLVFPSAWVEDPPEQRQALLETIAKTHHVGIINANWGPGVPRIGTQGRSLIIGPDGRLLAETPREVPGPHYLTYSPSGHANTP